MAFKSDDISSRLQRAGMNPSSAMAKAELFARLSLSADPTVAAFVPGRIELFGKHTDYCGGRSLLCTVDRGFCMIASPRTDGVISITAAADGGTVEFRTGGELPRRPGHWSTYASAVVQRTAANFPSARLGAHIVFISDLPAAAGLSSSSALITGLFVMLSRVAGLAETAEWKANLRTPEDLAAYCGCIENGSTFGTLAGSKGVGTFGGSQDHTAILCCKPGMISQFHFGPLTREADLVFTDGVKLAVLVSGVVAEKSAAAMEKYNNVSLRARRLVELWNEKYGTRLRYLNEVVSQPGGQLQLAFRLSKLPDAERLSLTLRLEQFIGESTLIIPAAAHVITTGDLSRLGSLASQSHSLAVTHLQNQVPQTIELQQWAMDHGAIAASAFGAGFGGSVWALFPENASVELPSGSFFTAPSVPLTILEC